MNCAPSPVALATALPRRPSVSVIIPTFNRADLLRGSVESVLSQTHPVAEVLIVDDGSTDETASVVQSMTDRQAGNGPRLRYLRQPNAGKSVAINQALALVSSEWIAFNDSDDRWHPEKVERQLHALRRHPDARACFTNASYSHRYHGRASEFEGGLDVSGELGQLRDSVSTALTNRRIRMQTVLVRADAMQAAGNFDPAMRVAQDVDFILRLSLVTPLCYVNLPLVEINRDPTHATRLTVQHALASRARDEAHEHMLAKWQPLLRAHRPDLCRQLSRDLWRKRSALANHLLLAGDTRGARAVLARGLRDRFNARLFLKLGLTLIAPGLYVRALMHDALRERASLSTL